MIIVHRLFSNSILYGRKVIMDYDKLLVMTTSMGSMLLENGAEIYRVEDSINLILKAYGVHQSDVFAIPACIIVTITDSFGHSYTKLLRVVSKGTNLHKMAMFNNLCRTICNETPSFEKIYEDIEKINKERQYNFGLQILSRAIIAAAFTLFYGGTIVDAACALLCGASISITGHNMRRFDTNNFFTNIVSSAVASSIALLLFHVGIAVNADKMIIGSFMNLVPGVAITTLMRDMITGDLLAGIAKLTESILVGLAIAIGAAIAISLSRVLIGG